MQHRISEKKGYPTVAELKPKTPTPPESSPGLRLRIHIEFTDLLEASELLGGRGRLFLCFLEQIKINIYKRRRLEGH